MEYFSIWNCLYVFAASIGGSVVQTTTGFGYGIFVMLVTFSNHIVNKAVIAQGVCRDFQEE